MLNTVRTNSKDVAFIKLVEALDLYLAQRNGEQDPFYRAFNKIEAIQHCVVAYHQDIAVGCGAFKILENDCVEIKRMYVIPEKRGLGIASAILTELETWAMQLKSTRAILETGNKFVDAISLYKKAHYQRIPNYPPYEEMPDSVCFAKKLL
jgi:putative acetyltransferase